MTRWTQPTPMNHGFIHDGFCRCPVCKPPLVGASATMSLRLRLALIAGAFALGIIISVVS